MNAQRLSSLSALSRPVPLRANPLLRAERRVVQVSAIFGGRQRNDRAGELVADFLSVVSKAGIGKPLVGESQERVEELLKEIAKSSVRNAARSPGLAGTYQVVYTSRSTIPSSFINVRNQRQTYGRDGSVKNDATFSIGGLLPASSQQYGKFKATGPNTLEILFDTTVINKGFLGREEKEIEPAQGQRKFQIVYLGPDALVLRSLLRPASLPESEPYTPSLLVFKPVPEKKTEEAVKGTVQIQKKPPANIKKGKQPAISQAAKGTDVAAQRAEKLKAEKAAKAAKAAEAAKAAKAAKAAEAAKAAKAAKAAEAVKAAEAAKAAQAEKAAKAEKAKLEKQKREAKVKAEREAKEAQRKAEMQKRDAKLKAEQEAKAAALEAERQKREKEAAALRQRQLKEQLASAIEEQTQRVADAQAASRAALDALRLAEREGQPILKEAAAAEKKVQAAQAATSKAANEAEKALTAKKNAEEQIKSAQQEVQKLQASARVARV